MAHHGQTGRSCSGLMCGPGRRATQVSVPQGRNPQLLTWWSGAGRTADLPPFRLTVTLACSLAASTVRRPPAVLTLEPTEQPLGLASPSRLSSIAALGAPAAGVGTCTGLPAPS